MKRLLLLRHAKSSWEVEGLHDYFRPLNERGYADAPIIAQFIHNQQVLPELVVASPAIRTYTTASIVMQQLKMSQNSLKLHSTLYDSGIEDYLKVVSELHNRHETVLLVGHNSSISDLLNTLLKTTDLYLPTCGLAVLEIQTDQWHEIGSAGAQLILMTTPKQLKGQLD